MLSIDLQDQLFPCAFSLDSKYIAMLDDKGTVSIIEIASGQRKATLKHESVVGSIAFSPDGK